MTQQQVAQLSGSIRAARRSVLDGLVAYNKLGADNPGILTDEIAEMLADAIAVHDAVLETLQAEG